MDKLIYFLVIWLQIFLVTAQTVAQNPASEYIVLQKEFATGWNTWNYRSLLSHVLLPEGFTLNLGFKDYLNKDVLNETMLGYGQAEIRMGAHAWDGSYTCVQIDWTDLHLS